MRTARRVRSPHAEQLLHELSTLLTSTPNVVESRAALTATGVYVSAVELAALELNTYL